MSKEINEIIDKFEVIFRKRDKSHHAPYFDQIEKIT